MNIQEIVKQIQSAKKEGIKEVYLVACGGSLVDMYASKYLLESEARELRVGFYTSNEFVHATPKALGESSVTIVCSHGGNTPESVEAARLARAHGSTTITLTHNEQANLIQHADHNILYLWGAESNVKNNPMAIILHITFEILHATEGFDYHDKVLEGLERINGIIEKAKVLVADRAKAFAERFEHEDLFYVMSSGASYGHAYGFSICSLMEMQWVNASAIHSGEYFHGPFEVTDKETPYILLVNEGRTRALDERALKFLNTYAEKVEVIDSKELGISTIDDTVVEYFNPILFYSILDVYRTELSKIRQHPLETRRYMGKVAY